VLEGGGGGSAVRGVAALEDDIAAAVTAAEAAVDDMANDTPLLLAVVTGFATLEDGTFTAGMEALVFARACAVAATEPPKAGALP
jgi:hypothetical protein